MNKLPIVCVIGYSNSGKTRTVVELVQILTRRGYRVGTAKHCHDGFHLDVEGKDSWLHEQAGAVATLMSGGGRIALIQDAPEPIALTALAERDLSVADILLAEGFSWEANPKILVVGSNDSSAKTVTDESIFAVVRPDQLAMQLPQFAFDEMEKLATLIEERFLK